MTFSYGSVGAGATGNGKGQLLSGYIVATSADSTTSTIHGPTFTNSEFRINAMAATFTATAATGSTALAQLTLKGSHDGTNFFTVVGSAGTAIQSTAADITTASTTNVIFNIDTANYGRTSFAIPYFRWDVALTGTTPGWTGQVNVGVIRNAY